MNNNDGCLSRFVGADWGYASPISHTSDVLVDCVCTATTVDERSSFRCVTGVCGPGAHAEGSRGQPGNTRVLPILFVPGGT